MLGVNHAKVPIFSNNCWLTTTVDHCLTTRFIKKL
jgi:hypothetical protein